jgi:hypothetical protein
LHELKGGFSRNMYSRWPQNQRPCLDSQGFACANPKVAYKLYRTDCDGQVNRERPGGYGRGYVIAEVPKKRAGHVQRRSALPELKLLLQHLATSSTRVAYGASRLGGATEHCGPQESTCLQCKDVAALLNARIGCHVYATCHVRISYPGRSERSGLVKVDPNMAFASAPFGWVVRK